MVRLSRDTMLMDMAAVVARRGTCSRLSVGVVLSKDGRVVSMGYNGAPAGMPHCIHTMDETEGCKNAEHAERNAIAFSARHGVALEGTEMHVTHMPCLDCARSVINAGIIRVSFLKGYRITDGVDLLRAAGIEVVDLRPEF
jgi:dCMP deaminase